MCSTKGSFLASKELREFIHHKHVLVRTGSTSVVYHIIHQGGSRYAVQSPGRLVATDLGMAPSCISVMKTSPPVRLRGGEM